MRQKPPPRRGNCCGRHGIKVVKSRRTHLAHAKAILCEDSRKSHDVHRRGARGIGVAGRECGGGEVDHLQDDDEARDGVEIIAWNVAPREADHDGVRRNNSEQHLYKQVAHHGTVSPLRLIFWMGMPPPPTDCDSRASYAVRRPCAQLAN